MLDNEQTVRIWAFEDIARWMVFASIPTLRDPSLRNPMDTPYIIQWYGDPTEIANDLIVLRMAL